jgi:[ribosomal protein S5]-alanine N-acetyltransferase
MPTDPYELRTPRLRLRALSLDDAQLALSGDRRALAARIAASVPADWPEPALSESLPGIVAHMARLPGGEGWLWVIIERKSAAMIGDIGFHGPVTGTSSVEIGYLIFPSARGHGYATEAATGLLDWAFSQPGIERVTAQIAPDNVASLRVAEKLGMRETTAKQPGFRCFERLKSEPGE